MKGMRGFLPRIPLRYFQSDPAASRHVLLFNLGRDLWSNKENAFGQDWLSWGG